MINKDSPLFPQLPEQAQFDFTVKYNPFTKRRQVPTGAFDIEEDIDPATFGLGDDELEGWE